jgi:hypothetical protein
MSISAIDIGVLHGGRLNRRRKPWLIWLAPVFLLFQGVRTGAFAALMVDANSLHYIETEAGIEVPAFIAFAILGAICITCLTGAYGLFRERWWARPLLTLVPPAIGIVAVIALGIRSDATIAMLLSADWMGLALAAAVYLYFYRYPPTVRYYERLREEHLSQAGAGPISSG